MAQAQKKEMPEVIDFNKAKAEIEKGKKEQLRVAVDYPDKGKPARMLWNYEDGIIIEREKDGKVVKLLSCSPDDLEIVKRLIEKAPQIPLFNEKLKRLKNENSK